MSDAVRLMKQNRTRGSASRKSKLSWSLQRGETLFAETRCFCEWVFMSVTWTIKVNFGATPYHYP